MQRIRYDIVAPLGQKAMGIFKFSKLEFVFF